jgi:hypothetical protein
MGSCGSKEPSVEGSAATLSPKKAPTSGVAGGTEKKASAPTENMVRTWLYLVCEIISEMRGFFFGKAYHSTSLINIDHMLPVYILTMLFFFHASIVQE